MRAALLVALLISTPAFAAADKATAGATEATEVTAEAPASEKDKLICKRIAASESRMAAKRVCLSAADWKKMQSQEDR